MPSWLRSIVFRVHWAIGVCAGLVLAIVGLSGAVLSFQDEIVDALNPALQAPEGGVRLAPDALVARATAAHPELDLRGLVIPLDGDAPAEARMGVPGERGGTAVAIDPWRGTVLGARRGEGTLHTIEQLHRNLVAGEAGKQLVGASTLALLVLAISGVVLRWPRRARSPSAWLKPDTRLRGRAWMFNLHAVLATWVLLFYVVSALSGLWWSYAFYRNAVSAIAGVPAPQGRGPAAPPVAGAPVVRVAPPSFDASWSVLRDEAPGAVRAMVSVPPQPGAPIEWRYLERDASHDRAFSLLKVDAASGALLAHERWAELPRGRRFVATIFPLHSGSWLGMPGRVLMMLASLLMPFFAVTGIWLWVLRRRLARRSPAALGVPAIPASAAAVEASSL